MAAARNKERMRVVECVLGGLMFGLALALTSCVAHSGGAIPAPDDGAVMNSLRSFLIDTSDSLEREWRKTVRQLVQESPAAVKPQQDPWSDEISLAIDGTGRL